MNEEFIPTFEIEPTKDEYAILRQVDEFEDKIQLLNKLSKEYDGIKKTVKEFMVKVGKDNDLDQVKWITPKGIKITCSIGHKPIFEKVTENQFDIDILKRDYPEVYEKCCKEVTYDNCIKAATSDRLVITPVKGE